MSQQPARNTSPDLTILENTLSRLLQWIGAADAKISPILTINTAMLGTLAAFAPKPSEWTGAMTFTVSASVILLGISIIYLFRAAYPRTKGPKVSLVYFGGITEQTEDQFLGSILQLDPDMYAKDLARQCYRNAQIAGEKFSYVKTATQTWLGSVIPWLLSLYLMYGVSD